MRQPGVFSYDGPHSLLNVIVIVPSLELAW